MRLFLEALEVDAAEADQLGATLREGCKALPDPKPLTEPGPARVCQNRSKAEKSDSRATSAHGIALSVPRARQKAQAEPTTPITDSESVGKAMRQPC